MWAAAPPHNPPLQETQRPHCLAPTALQEVEELCEPLHLNTSPLQEIHTNVLLLHCFCRRWRSCVRSGSRSRCMGSCQRCSGRRWRRRCCLGAGGGCSWGCSN